MRTTLPGGCSPSRRGALSLLLQVALVLVAGLWSSEALAQKSKPLPLAGDEIKILTVEGQTELWTPAGTDWEPAKPNQILRIGARIRTGKLARATILFSDRSVLRIGESTTFEILPPIQKDTKPLVSLRNGLLYFFSREKPRDIQFRTPTAAGAIRGTEFLLQAEEVTGETLLALLEGEVELGNEAGQIQLRGGEQARVSKGQVPNKTALIDAINVIQWCLYYPAVAEAEEINFSVAEKEALRDSLTAYRSGDLLQALAAFPGGKLPPTEAVLVFEAALRLSVGQVEQASRLLDNAPAANALAEALRKMVAAVQYKTWTRTNQPVLGSAWLAESYYLQSRSRLGEALKAAESAAEKSPTAQRALAKGLRASPRHAQGLALQGFLLAASNDIKSALDQFDQAIAVDGALGNAWLGRGLCRIRQGYREEGRRDLEVAAALEPQRSLLRSYLGKAFSNAGDDAHAEKELKLARKFDPNDPTSWLYLALLEQQGNRINEAIRALEKSQKLNDKRSLFRSKFLLDQDQAVRGANLAGIYRDAGMTEVSVREAARAVSYDYANYSAHLFLANSFDALRDPRQANLRYETPAVSEYFIANLLAPVGGTPLSQNVSQQEYARLFERDQMGVASSTDYSSRGSWTQQGSQYGRYDRVSYSLDADYRTEPGNRPNNDSEWTEFTARIKLQMTPKDSVYFEAGRKEGTFGDVNQLYNQANGDFSSRYKETQEPNLYLGYHREWSPGVHTLFLAGRLDDAFTHQNTDQPIRAISHIGGIESVNQYPEASANPGFHGYPTDLRYQSDLLAYTVELQQIWQVQQNTLIAGGRYQTGSSDNHEYMAQPDHSFPLYLQGLLSNTNISVDLNRLSFYAYDYLQVAESLRLIGGISYDRLNYPLNSEIPPISGAGETREQVSPKAGFLLTPWKDASVRGAYTRSLGGVFFDNSIRLEPSQIAGFNQALRSAIPESVIGLVPGTRFDTFGLGFDQKFGTGTYVGLAGEMLYSTAERGYGVFETTSPLGPATKSLTRERLEFRERSLAFNLNQLLGDNVALGLRYRLTEAKLLDTFPQIPELVTRNPSDVFLNQAQSALLHQVNLYALFYHRCGFFTQFEAVWSGQSNYGYQNMPGDDFWQLNAYVGYRFWRRHAEVRLGLLNMTAHDYRLNPLTLYSELPRERTLVASFKFCF
ncbi:MAG: FecR domain-containing protein [Verrucomicrobia bacterium]|nr:FecR domain-containing protein [Verrucomicrobiota bacterium]